MVNILKDGCEVCDQFVRFGNTGVLGKNYDDTFVVENDKGYNTIGIRVDAPTGGTVQFEGTFDNDTWEPVTLRSIDEDEDVQTTDNGSSFIGSVAALSAFRIRTIVAGTSPGTVRGRASVGVSVLENIEHGWAPHKFGHPTVHKDKSYTTVQADQTIWQPASGKRVVVTDMILNASGNTDANVSIYLNSDSEGNRLFKGDVNVTQNNQWTFAHSYRVPFEAQVADYPVNITTSNGIKLDIMLHGYEV
jgi:hypothetical protein